MRTKVLSQITLALLLMALLAQAFTIQPVKAQPKTWIVDDDGPGDFHTIQEAINAANTGDYIYVINGTYQENVVVDKSVWLVGEKQEITNINGGGTGTVVSITASHVVVSNFTIINSGDQSGDAGIRLEGSEGSLINKNSLTNNVCHIYLVDSNGNTIVRNLLSGNDCGLNMTSSDDNNIAFNLFLGSKIGISLNADSNGNNFTRNNVTSCTQHGIFAGSGGNTFYHNNFVQNQKQVETDAINTWDNNSPSGGNYWSNYTGVDNNGDGLGDTRYEIDLNNIDHYPLIRPANDTLLLTDLNDDRVTDIRDISIAAQAYGGIPGSLKWSLLADINGDLRTDLKDLGPILLNFQKRYP